MVLQAMRQEPLAHKGLLDNRCHRAEISSRSRKAKEAVNSLSEAASSCRKGMLHPLLAWKVSVTLSGIFGKQCLGIRLLDG